MVLFVLSDITMPKSISFKGSMLPLQLVILHGLTFATLVLKIELTVEDDVAWNFILFWGVLKN
jgi:hypothetical protein